MAGFKVEKKGDTLKFIEHLGNSVSSQIYVQVRLEPHHYVIPSTREHPKTSYRSERDAFLVLNKQKKDGRNPIFLDDRENQSLNEIAKNYMAEFNKSGDKKYLIKAMERCAEKLREIIMEHVDKGKSDGGEMEPLKEKYKRWKKKATLASFGREGNRILRRSGALMDHIVCKPIVK